MAIRGELYTNQVKVDKRSYFFNVKENRNGDVFLQVVESKGGEDERHAIVIFADEMQQFLSGMEDSLKFIEKNRKENAKAKAEKKAAKEAKYGRKPASSDTKKVYKRKSTKDGETERVFTSQVKKTGRVHVVSKRKTDDK